jgi:hypothetical protein
MNWSFDGSAWLDTGFGFVVLLLRTAILDLSRPAPFCQITEVPSW